MEEKKKEKEKEREQKSRGSRSSAEAETGRCQRVNESTDLLRVLLSASLSSFFARQRTRRESDTDTEIPSSPLDPPQSDLLSRFFFLFSFSFLFRVDSNPLFVVQLRNYGWT